VRLYLTFVLLAFGGVAYLWNSHPVSPAAETATDTDNDRHLFDWQQAGDPLNAIARDASAALDEAPLIVRDTINTTRTEITTVLDEFVRVNGTTNATPAPTDDIVAQSGLSEPGLSEPIPFASSESASSDIEPADAASASGNAGNPRAGEQPLEATSNEPKSANGKPAINEATLVTKKPGTKTETPRTREPVTASKPSTETRPKSELLPSGKLPEKTAPIVDSGWNVVAKSTSGMPMHTRQFGRQGPKTMIVAGLDGRDLVASGWNDELADALSQKKDLLQSNEVLVFRAGNPDGLTNRSPVNPRSVMINRNFPGRRFRRLPDRSSGTGPSSEVETQAIVDSLSTFRPQRLIHLTSTTGPSTIVYNRAAKDQAIDLEQRFQWKAIPFDGDQMPGSLEDYADGTLDIAVLTLRLNSGPDWQQAWQKHLPGVLSAIQGKTPLLSVSNGPIQTKPERNGSPVRLDEEPAPVKKSQRGYEELPPPPR